MVAVSQAPSPESNPYSPLPVEAIARLDRAIKSNDRAENRMNWLQIKLKTGKDTMSDQRPGFTPGWFLSNIRNGVDRYIHMY